MSNELHMENSPYLLQHAGNPVHWKAWNEEVLKKAQNENKLILVSIGYAACHWCHVMEKESFEDTDVARVMNENFINIKVDREERPDIDQLYMSAVQVMTGSGGWPLNVIALPDGRPIWGGTYFRREQWTSVISQVSELYHRDPDKVQGYAEKLAEGISMMNMVSPPGSAELPGRSDIAEAINKWQPYMDPKNGGRKGAPKFMMPVNLDFLLKYAHLTSDISLDAYLKTTLKRMAYGGIYDHLGGGFARYSTDERWHIPHFEMMLYDNAQLLSSYSLAYKRYKEPEYLEVIAGIYRFMTRELGSPEGAFYASLDADSMDQYGTLKEGAFYTWTMNELEEILGDDFELFATVYNINAKGYWEEKQYVLFREETFENLAAITGIPMEKLQKTIEACEKKLFKIRDQRQRPALDDKIITSWNALAITGLTQAFLCSGNSIYLEAAVQGASFIEKIMFDDKGMLLHTYCKGARGSHGFLEDYAFLIEACINLFMAGAGERYILQARQLCNYAIDNFYDDHSKMFSFTPVREPHPVSRPLEKSDNVIPASNSAMARNLRVLGVIFGNTAYTDLSMEMLRRMQDDALTYPYSHANWLNLALETIFPSAEVAICGPEATNKAAQLQKHYLPNTIIAPAEKPSNIPLLKGRYKENSTLFYVCRDRQCDLPDTSIEDCLNKIISTTK